MVEYALITALIAVVSGYTMVTTPAVADSMKKIFNNVAKYLALAAGASQAISC
jgi:Flp pilus assembly pilin Flp